MRFLEWNHDYFGDGKYTVFMIVSRAEMLDMVSYYKTPLARSATFHPAHIDEPLGSEEYYYFLNTKDKIVVPMADYNWAFGSLYNGYPPYGDEIHTISFRKEEYSLGFDAHDMRARRFSAIRKHRATSRAIEGNFLIFLKLLKIMKTPQTLDTKGFAAFLLVEIR